ncbi:MAG: (d)CMP kinase [Bacteroidetes bacterium]|nr:MAG: (d)CMP kinase [Bacteroidota bacterium]
MIIAIDGPAASGKSTTARLVAQRLQYLHIDTGAMYRAMALKVLRSGIHPDDREAVARLARTTTVRLVPAEPGSQKVRVELDGAAVTDEIRLPEVTGIVSPVSTIADVRALMVKEQRAMGREGGIVLEGRDIGTVVFPQAELKVFMKAEPRERARRRGMELKEKGLDVPLESLEADIIERDRIDSQRALSPLRRADDAVEVDTTDMTIEQQVEFIVRKAEERIARSKDGKTEA